VICTSLVVLAMKVNKFRYHAAGMQDPGFERRLELALQSLHSAGMQTDCYEKGYSLICSV
jgi:hypothetical protein